MTAFTAEDLVPIVVTAVPVQGGTLHPVGEPLTLALRIYTDGVGGDWLTFDCPDLGLDDIDRTRADLVDSVAGSLAFLWAEYATEDDARLDPRVLGLAARLRARFRFVPAPIEDAR